MMLLYACAFGAAVLLVGVGWAAFWPECPPIEPGQHRPAPRERKARAAVLDENLEEPIPTNATAEEWMWTTEGQRRHRARHRHENLGEGTQRLQWHERPTGP